MPSRYLLVALACFIGTAAGAETGASGAEEIVPSGWSLEESTTAGNNSLRKANRGQTSRTLSSKKAKPRVFGRARISNSRMKSRKGGASVGVAVPF